jgi:hypothetical protein
LGQLNILDKIYVNVQFLKVGEANEDVYPFLCHCWPLPNYNPFWNVFELVLPEGAELKMDSQVSQVLANLSRIQDLCVSLVENVSSFEVANVKALPYGLKPHTRSVAWLVEQVVVQRLKLDAPRMGVREVDYDLPDTALHDLTIRLGNDILYINLKAHQSEKKANKNDISAVEKLYDAYVQDENYNLYYAAFGIKFSERSVVFLKDAVHCFSPQFLPIYVNPRNDKIQAFYHHEPIIRSRRDFLKELSVASKSIQL